MNRQKVIMNNEMVKASFSDNWSKISEETPLWVITQNQSFLIEGPNEYEDYSLVRTFSTREEAFDYKNDLIEQGLYKPSELAIERLLLSEIFELIEELEVLSQEFYNCPVRVSFAEFYNGEIVFEDLLHDSENMVN